MIASTLRVELERYAAQMRVSNPLFFKAADGSLTSACMTLYLANVRHLVLHTPIHLTRAASRARELGDPALAEHYENKRGEEHGHDAWADRDIERMSMMSSRGSQDVLSPFCDLVEFIGNVIDEDPALYLSYILFAEYLIVLLGSEWLALLEERCGIPRTSMTVVGNHIELDRDHADAALDQIDALVGDQKKLPRMREVLRDVLAHFDRFCAEVTRDRVHGVETLAESDGVQQASAG
jgi:hypothetical protein